MNNYIEIVSNDTDKGKRALKERLKKDAWKKCEPSFSSEYEEIDLCADATFYVKTEVGLYLCGTTNIEKKITRINSHRYYREYISDLGIYCDNIMWTNINHISIKKSFDGFMEPIILFRNSDGKFEHIIYGEVYDGKDLNEIIVIYRKERYISHDKRFYDLYVWENGEIQFEKHNVNYFFAFRNNLDYFMYSTSNSGNGVKYLYNVVSGIKKKLVTRYMGNIYEASPENIIENENKWAIPDRYIKIFFTMGDSIGARILFNFGMERGYVRETTNMFLIDATDNYLLEINRKETEDIGFVYTVMGQVADLRLKIFGIPLYQFVNFLGGLEFNEKYISEMERIVDEFIREKQTNNYKEIKRLLVKKYGEFSLKSYSEQKEYLYVNGMMKYDFSPLNFLSYFPNHDISKNAMKKLSNSLLKAEWKSEVRLFLIFWSYYPDSIQHYKTKWLGKQHLDIFIPSLNVAVEYQGEQHYTDNIFIGENFEKIKFLDEQKRKRCKENKVTLIEWPYTYMISEINVLCELKKIGIEQIPAPCKYKRWENID